MKRLICAIFIAGILGCAAEGFEGFKVGGFTTLKSDLGEWRSEEGLAAVKGRHATGGVAVFSVGWSVSNRVLRKKLIGDSSEGGCGSSLPAVKAFEEEAAGSGVGRR